MTALDTRLPRERLDARIGWQAIRVDGQPQANGLVEQGAVLHLATAVVGADGLVFAQPIPDGEVCGSFGGRTLPRGLVISDQGEVYLADPAGGRVLYTRASLPPEFDPSDPFAPFVPLYARPGEADHPMRLTRVLDLGLVPVDAPVGSMADALIVADAGAKDRLLWLDRRHGVLRHEASLPGAPVALGVSGAGLVRVAVVLGTAATLLTLRYGRITRSDALARVPHSVRVLDDGRAVLADQAGLWAVGLDGQDADPKGDFTPPLTVGPAGPEWRNGCAKRDPMRFPSIRIDRRGALNGTGLPIITLPRRLPRPRRGAWIAGPFDGAARGFAWHRIGLDATVPDQCRLLLSTHVSDFSEEVTPLTAWSDPIVVNPGDLPEALIQINRGRYLWLKIEAFGNGTDTPEITGIDIFGPRRSQLDYLPAPFREDPESADFLDRFLSLQDVFFAEALARFDTLGAILRPVAAPPEFLNWLGGWFDWQFLAEWDEDTRRQMIALSMRFFKARGTIAGLAQMLRWHIGPAGAFPVILENYRMADWVATPLPDGATRPLWIGGTQITPDSGAHEFTVVLPQAVALTKAARDQIDRIIAAQKPAHTLHHTIYVAPGCRLGEQALLGIDAILADTRPQPLGLGRLGDGSSTVAAC